LQPRRHYTRFFARTELISCGFVAGIGDAGVNLIFRNGNAVRTTRSTWFSRQRENLDSSSSRLAMLALCKKMLEQETIEKLNANFCLKGWPDKLNRSRCYLIDQGYLASEPQADRSVSAKQAPRNANFQGGPQTPGRTRNQAQPKTVRRALARDHREKIAQRCAAKFRGKI